MRLFWIKEKEEKDQEPKSTKERRTKRGKENKRIREIKSAAKVYDWGKDQHPIYDIEAFKEKSRLISSYIFFQSCVRKFFLECSTTRKKIENRKLLKREEEERKR